MEGGMLGTHGNTPTSGACVLQRDKLLPRLISTASWMGCCWTRVACPRLRSVA